MAARKKAGAPRVRKPDPWRNRIVGHGELTADEIEAHPDNPRVHGRAQKAAMTEMFDDVGWVQTVIVNQRTGRLLDGHMRAALAAGRGPVPVSFVDLDEDEERKVLAMMDPIGAMATHDAETLRELTAEMDAGEALSDLVSSLLPGGADQDDDLEPDEVELAPLRNAYILVVVPLDRWDAVVETVEHLEAVDGVQVHRSVN